MSFVASAVTSSTARPVALRVRPDLKFERQTYQGEVSWVVKDPLALKYYRLPEEEYAALKMLDGETTLDDIKIEIERKYAPVIIEYSEIQSLLGMFHQFGLVMSFAEGQGQQLFKRRSKNRRQQLLGKFASILSIRLPGFDPERILTWAYPKVRWFYSRWCFSLCIAMAVCALLLVVIHIDEFYRKLPRFHEFFSFPNLIWMMAAMGVAKVLHEFGHGMTCKHFGGECHEIGVMFLVFTPCLYCDTSDSWMLKSKWARAAIGAGGMYVEVVLATICTFIWWNTDPGLLHYLCLSTMFVCSVSTVVFNSNPLLRYDGYYILSDILEVPNLAQKARNALLALLRHWCLGMPWNEQQLSLPPRNRGWFAFYAVASTVYRWMVLVFILYFLTKIFEPYGLQALGHMMLASSLVSIIVIPLYKTIRYFMVPGRMRQVKKVRLLLTVALAAGVVSAIALIPLPHRVMTTLTIQPQGAEPIYVSLAGTRDEALSFKPGDYVEKDTRLTTLRNVAVDNEIRAHEGQLATIEVEIEKLKMRRSSDPSVDALIPEADKRKESVQQRLAEQRTEQARLTLITPVSGYILPPVETPVQPHGDGTLPKWSGTPLDEINQGAYLETGTSFCLVGDPKKVEAIIIIDQGDMEFVRPGMRVDIKLDEYPNQVITGQIEEIARIDLQVTPRELSGKAGGELTTKTDDAGREKPMSASYQARVPIEDFDGSLLQGFRGRAKIYVGSRTLGQALARFLFKTFRFG